MSRENNYFQEGLDSEVEKFIKIIHEKDNHVLFKIKSYNKDKQQFLDEGLIISLIDSYSSFSNFFISKLHKDNMSLSMNIKYTSFENLENGKEYYMFVKIIIEKKNYILYEIQILNEKEKLIKYATHLKKIIKQKF